jgi:hypothetical protein
VPADNFPHALSGLKNESLRGAQVPPAFMRPGRADSEVQASSAPSCPGLSRAASAVPSSRASSDWRSAAVCASAAGATSCRNAATAWGPLAVEGSEGRTRYTLIERLG